MKAGDCESLPLSTDMHGRSTFMDAGIHAARDESFEVRSLLRR